MNSIDFKNALSTMANSVAVILVENQEEIVGCTVSSVFSTNIDEPEIAFVLKKNSYIGNILAKCGYSTINFLSRNQEEIADYYSSPNRTAMTSHVRWSRNALGEVIIAKSSFILSATFSKVVKLPKCDIYIMSVIACEITDEQVLIYQNRKYQK